MLVKRENCLFFFVIDAYSFRITVQGHLEQNLQKWYQLESLVSSETSKNISWCKKFPMLYLAFFSAFYHANQSCSMEYNFMFHVFY